MSRLEYDVFGMPFIRIPSHPDVLWTSHGSDNDNDLRVLMQNLNDPAVHYHLMNVPSPYTAAHAAAYLRDGLAISHQCAPILRRSSPARTIPPDIRALPLNLLRDALTGTVIGSLTLKVVSPLHGEIGYWLSPAYQRRGIMRAALRVALVHAADDWDGLERLTIQVRQGNVASRGTALGAGFKPVDEPVKVDWPNSKGGGEAWLETLEVKLPLKDLQFPSQ